MLKIAINIYQLAVIANFTFNKNIIIAINYNKYNL